MAYITKLAILTFMILLTIGGASAQWLRQAHDDDRSMYYDDAIATFTATNSSTISITCGTDNAQALYQSPAIYGTFGDSDAYPDMFLMCAPDSDTNHPHLRMISDNLIELDNIVVSSADQTSEDWMPFSICEFDGDTGTTEFCLLNNEDTTPPFTTYSILIYSFDTGGSETFTKIGEWNLNSTGATIQTDSGDYNVSTFGTQNDPTQTTIECYFGNDPTCYIAHANYIYATNMTVNNSVKWITPVTNAVFYSSTHNAPPLFDGDYIYTLNTTGGYINRINATDGSIDGYILDASYDFDWWAIDDCDAGDCVSGKELLTADYTNDDEIFMYSLADGSFLESVATGTNTGNIRHGWIEDRDSDGTDELCGIFIDITEGGAGTSYIKCEELNFFAFDTINDNFAMNTTSDAGALHNIVMADFNNDGLNDIMASDTIILLGSSSAVPTVIQSIYDTISPTVDKSSIYSLYDSAVDSIGTFLSWVPNADNDTVFLTTSQVIEEFIVNSQIEFVSDSTFIPPYNQIWDDASDGTYSWNGSANLPISRPAICQNSSVISWYCGYNTFCLTDDEFDSYYIKLDCFGDGTQRITTGAHYNTGQASLSCYPSYVSPGNYTADFEITDVEHNWTDNISISIPFEILTSDCADDTTYQDNDYGRFINAPTPSRSAPYCRSGYGTSVIWTCPEGTCWNDTEGDSLYGFNIDCNGDGVFEKFTTLESWTCTYASAITNSKFQVFTEGRPDYGEIKAVPIFTTTDTDVCAGMTADSPTMLTGSGSLVPGYPQPFCENTTVEFTCTDGSCFYDPLDTGSVSLAIDCESDGVYEQFIENLGGVDDLIFECTTGIAGIYNITLRAINTAGSSAPAVYSFNVSATACFDSSVTADPTIGQNAIYRYYYQLGQIFNMSVNVVGWLMILFATGTVLWYGYRTGSNWTITGGALTFACLEVFHAIMGIHGWTTVIVMVVIAVGFGIARHAGITSGGE